jgi:hypothetical protein
MLTTGGYEPLINGGTNTSFSSPYALTDLKPGGDRQLFTCSLGSGGILNRPAGRGRADLVPADHLDAN